MNYELSNSRKQGHVELTLYYVLCITNSIEISSKSWVRVDLRALVRSLLSMRRQSREWGNNRAKPSGLVCDQKHRVEGQTDTDGPSCVLRTVKSRARPKGWCIIKG